MEKVTESTKANNSKIIIHTGKILDCRAHREFAQACQLAKKKDVHAIVVDFTDTKGIRDTGLNMLLMLNLEADALQVQIRLENCNPEIKTRLFSSRLRTGLYVA